MLRFRPPTEKLGPVTDLLAVGQVIDDAMRPGNFFISPDLIVEWIAGKSETIPWEVFRGRLLDAAQTRLERSFLSWHMVQVSPLPPREGPGVSTSVPHSQPRSRGEMGESPEPTISVKLDVHERKIHVTRGLLCYVHEGYDAGGGVIESREVVKWQRELVGAIILADFADLEEVRDELICLIWQAVVGTSRLPLTSVEAPLPAFSFGQLHYLYQLAPRAESWASWEEWLTRGINAPCTRCELVKLVEFVLRHIPATSKDPVASQRLRQLLRAEWPRVYKKDTEAPCHLPPSLTGAIFNGASLSPYTHFVANAIASSWNCEHILRQLSRHLTAYDLVTFHHRGANYPDALLLDEVLHHLAEFAASWVGQEDFMFHKDAQRFRRALRQGCLLRHRYEGHLVPDEPTSPGENARVLPASHPRVPEEQLTQIMRRRVQLFADEPLSELLTDKARAVLAQSVRDLEHLDERVEMGLGLFIDRPVGYQKEIGEPDLTPMLAHEAFSPSIARRRWQELKKLCGELGIPCDAEKLDPLFEHGPWPQGLPHVELADCPRPTVSLTDVRKVAADFEILRTLPKGMAPILERVRPICEGFRLRFLAEGRARLCVNGLDSDKKPVLAIYDDEMRRRIELAVDASIGYITRAGLEFPRAGLRVLRVWQD